MNKKIYLLLILFITALTFPKSVLAEETPVGTYNADQMFLEKKINSDKIIQSSISKDINSEEERDKDIRKSFGGLNENSSGNKNDYTKFYGQKLSDDKNLNERPLLKKLLEKEIIRTDIVSYLLEDEATFRPKKGPVEKIQFFGAYNGYISSNWVAGDYDTKYTDSFIQVGATGKIRNTNNDFKVILNPKRVHGLTYMQNFVADAFITNKSIPHHEVIIGFSRNQVGKEGGATSYTLPFIMRSQIARNFGSTRALGVRLVGDYSLVDYHLAFNSSDRYFRKWFAGPEFTGWVDLKPLGKTNGKYGNLIIGGGLNTGKNDSNYTVGSLYADYKYKKFWTRFEYGIADGYNGSRVVNKKAEGLYALAGYNITPKIQILGRYDQFNPDRNISNDTRREYTAGINYFIKGQALKLFLNYVFCQNSNKHDSHRIMVGTQLML